MSDLLGLDDGMDQIESILFVCRNVKGGQAPKAQLDQRQGTRSDGESIRVSCD